MTALDFEPERKQVEEAVARAEQKSSAEVVCVVASESGRYDRAESLVGLVFAALGLFVADAAWAVAASGAWTAPTPLWVLVLGMTLGFVSGSVAASFVGPLRRLLVTKAELDDEVERAAAAAFARSGVAGTRGRTGVLVYVSLFERRVVVKPDAGVVAAAGDGFAKSLCERAVAGLKAGKRGAVLAELIDATAEALSQKLPPAADDSDELPNRLVLLHPR